MNKNSLRLLTGPIVLGVILSLLMGLSIFGSVLVGDEVFVVFALGPELYQTPSKIFSWAIQSSTAGWQDGRFISPLTHILSNLGVMLTYGTSEIFHIDPLVAYSMWRTFFLAVITSLGVLLIWRTLPSDLETNKTRFVLFVVSITVPASMCVNNSWAAPRESIWSYSLTFTLFLIYCVAMAALGNWKRVSSKTSSYRILLMCLMGLLFSTTYELTQVLAPVGILSYLLGTLKKEDYIHFKLRVIASKAIFIEIGTFLVFFLLPFLAIRISSYLKCQAGCYQTASINPGGFSFEQFVARFLSPITVFSAPLGFEDGNAGNQSKSLTLTFIFISLIFFAAIITVLIKYFQAKNTQNPRTINHSIWLVPLLLGFTINVFVSFGMAMSVAVQTEGLPIGKSSRDTLATDFGYALLLTSVVCILAGVIYLKKSTILTAVVTVLLSLLISLIGGFSYSSNLNSTLRDQTMGGNFLQYRLAAEVNVPDLTESGNERRCKLISQKIHEFPEWEGHDKSLNYGLNLIMLDKINRQFCDISPEELFMDYKGN